MSEFEYRAAPTEKIQNVDTPTVPPKEIHDLVAKRKAALEKETRRTYSTFVAKLYIKKDTEIVVRIDIGGGQYIDVLYDDEALMSYEEDKQLGDEMTTEI